MYTEFRPPLEGCTPQDPTPAFIWGPPPPRPPAKVLDVPPAPPGPTRINIEYQPKTNYEFPHRPSRDLSGWTRQMGCAALPYDTVHVRSPGRATGGCTGNR